MVRRILRTVVLAGMLIALPAVAAPAALAGPDPAVGSAASDEAAVYLSPHGDDAADGGPDAPVASLTRAAQLLADAGTETATVWIEPGTYYEPAVVAWNRVPQSLVALRSTSTSERPVFDGSRATGNLHYWMNTAGGPSLDVRGLTVRNYRTGGIRMDTAGNVVTDLVFERLGNQHVPDGPGYAALHLLGSSGNTVTDNVFRDLENLDCPGCIHAIYAANGSSDNRFTGNAMARITGDPVRLRHDTHRNVFERNTFARSGSRFAHRAMASFWRFRDTEACGVDNRVDRNVYDGRFYNGEPGQRIIGSGSEPGIESCPEAIRGYANVLTPSPVVP